MEKYIIRRLLVMPVMLLAITFIIFLLVNATPANPALTILGLDAGPEEVAQLNRELGFDKPLMIRYGSFLLNAVQGDFGVSYFSKRPVMGDVFSRLPNTLLLTFVSMGVALAVGIPLGMTCAVKQYSAADNILSTLAMFIAATPNFWLGAILMMVFCLWMGILPASGVSKGWKDWVLPILTTSMPYVGHYLRYSRSYMLDTIREDYVRTARSKGCNERAVLFTHALRNALLPLITVSAIQAGTLMAGATVVEEVFAIPGLGSLVLDSIKRKDIPLVLGCITVYAFIFFLITLIMDVLYAYIDPRIKANYIYHKKAGKLEAGAK